MAGNAFDLVRQLAASQYLVRALHVVTELGVADHLGDQPSTPERLAQQVGADADALGRLLRLLSSRGIFLCEGGTVTHTDASRLLGSAHPASLRAFVLMFAQPIQWQMAGDLMHAVRTGEAVAERAHPGGLWSYFQAFPEFGRVFDAAMAAKAGAQVAAILATYDFSDLGTVVDVGGGGGHLLRGILGNHAGTKGVLFDLPAVVEGARRAGPNDRLTFAPGDFFTTPIPAGDAVILMEVLHDWDDASCHRILEAVRRSMPVGGRLLVIETEVPEGNGPDWSKLLDIVMLAAFSARQRTEAEYAALLAADGFLMRKRIETPAGISIFEAEAV